MTDIFSNIFNREEADAEDSKKKSDDMRLQMAIAKSKEDADTKAREVKYFTSQFCMPL